MSLNVHPSAVASFDIKANSLINLIREIPIVGINKLKFPSEIEASATLTGKEIIGEIDVTSSNYRGRIVARFFQKNKKQYGLEPDDYLKIIQLAEALQKIPAIQSTLSVSYLELSLFNWVKKLFNQENVPASFMEYLEQQAGSSIEKITLWTPIANFEIEVSFPLSKSELRSLSKSVINAWEKKLVKPEDEKNEQVEYLLNHFRSEYQGLACVVTTLEAEPERARELAMEEAERITSILGVFSSATLIPDIKCSSRIKGSENIGTATTILELEGDRFSVNSQIVDIASAKTWRLSKEELSDIREPMLDKLSDLLAADALNAFEEAILSSILLYSKVAFTASPVEKLVYMLSSLESILLKNENEPIQQNLAERIAVFTEKTLIERKKIIKLVKSIYGIRSRYLHHGHSYAELGLISDFMCCVRKFFINLVVYNSHFKTKDDFVCAIDDHKLT